MKNEVNWGMFQDPMLTIIALILMATLWIIIPDTASDAPNAANSAELEKRLSLQKDSLALLQNRHEELERQLRDLDKTRLAMSAPLADELTSDNELALREQVQALQERIRSKTAELAELQRMLADIASKSGDKKAVEQMQQQIAMLQQQINQLQPLLTQLDEQLRAAQARDMESAAVAGQQQDEMDRLRQEITARELLLMRQDSLRSALEKTLANSRGLARYRSAAGKKQVAFECFNNTVLKVDDTSYSTENFLATRDGKTVVVGRVKRVVGARGESAAQVAASQSKFRARLAESTPSATYLYFFVHGNSQEIFLRAREIAWSQGYTVGWTPYESDTFYTSSEISVTQQVR